MMADSNPDEKPTGKPKDPNKYEESETETEGDEDESHPHKKAKREEPKKSPNILEDFDSEEDEAEESGIFDKAPICIWYKLNKWPNNWCVKVPLTYNCISTPTNKSLNDLYLSLCF